MSSKVTEEALSSSQSRAENVNEDAFPRCTEAQLRAARFDAWYPIFRKVTIRSCMIKMSPSFVRYVLEDGVVLPQTPEGVPLRTDDPRFTPHDDVEDLDSDEEIWSDEETDEDMSTRPLFPNIEKSICEKIAWLGGAAFVKVNWTSARDAKWVAGTLKCTSPGHVYLLLKSSNFVSQSLSWSTMRRQCTDDDRVDDREDDSVLVLRRWGNIRPSMEFRCFVREKRIVAASQRDAFSFYGFLRSKSSMIVSALRSFFEDEIRPRIDEMGSDWILDSFVMDVFVDRTYKVHLIDIDVMSRATDPLLFTWSEIQNVSVASPRTLELRLVLSEGQILPSSDNFYRLPKDVLDGMSGNTTRDAESASIAEIAQRECDNERGGENT